MRKPTLCAVICASLLLSKPSQAQEACPTGTTCVPKEDMEVIVKVLREKKCLQTEKPTFKLDPVTITTDVEGRVYYSGANPKPYTLEMHWCSYDVKAESKLDVVVAKRVPEEWGWRFRLKFASGFLFTDAIREKDAGQGLDVGLQAEFFYWKFLNLSVGSGFRSAGAQVGADLTKNFGFFAGYAFSFWTLLHNPQAGVYFSF